MNRRSMTSTAIKPAARALLAALSGLLLAPLLLMGPIPAEAQPPAKEPLVDQVRTAIDRGIGFLRQSEDGRGSWDNNAAPFFQRGGPSSLALLAMMNAGVKIDDPLVQRGLRYLRTLPPQQTYTVGLQTMVFLEAGQKEDLERIQRNVDWLLKNAIREGGKLRGWSYPQGNRPDNSNTQYALLGLHAGKAAGAKIDREEWEHIRNYYIESQQQAGGWNYHPSVGAGASLTMTVAGFCGLLISGMELNDGREVIQANGRATNCGVYKENEPAARAMGWVANHFMIGELRGAVYYNLYGLERAGRLSGQRFLGSHDWYREGCEYLVRAQNKDDGSWSGAASQFDRVPLISTSFALLFLSKGRTPILISKLTHEPGDDWNNDRNDARHLTEYASKTLFKKQPLAWQIFDPQRARTAVDNQLLEVVSDLLQAPIVYFNGHQAPNFRAGDIEMLQEYVNQGGFILAEACCGDPRFDRGFRETVVKKLFPNTELKLLDDQHPIWTAFHRVQPNNPFPLWGIKQGCKTVLVYSPRDLSCWWESNKLEDPTGQVAFRLGGNIIAYATGMELPKPRLTRVEVLDDRVVENVPRGYLKVAQLRHEGDWQPAPKAMPNLMLFLRQKARLDVVLKTTELDLKHDKLEDNKTPAVLSYKFLYMHGRNNFTLDATELKNLRSTLETGGLLLADACCGKKEFDTAFHKMADALFADQKGKPKLEHISLSDELFSKELNGTAITSVRCRRERPDGNGAEAEFREVAPYLEGIKLNGRWVVIYSKYDLGCALEKHQSPDCMGHDYPSALKLAGAVVLYAMKR